MPIGHTRSATILRQATLGSPPNAQKRKRATAAPPMDPQDVIELSSDDESPPAQKRQTPKRKAAPTSAEFSQDCEILEISSSSDNDVLSKPMASKVPGDSDVASLTKRHKTLQEVISDMRNLLPPWVLTCLLHVAQENNRLKKHLDGLRKKSDHTKRELENATRELSENKAKVCPCQMHRCVCDKANLALLVITSFEYGGCTLYSVVVHNSRDISFRI
jgi:hypothetical protein